MPAFPLGELAASAVTPRPVLTGLLLVEVVVVAFVSATVFATGLGLGLGLGLRVGDGEREAGTPPASRYQFVLGSPMHSPTATALYPRAIRVSSMKLTSVRAVCWCMS